MKNPRSYRAARPESRREAREGFLRAPLVRTTSERHRRLALTSSSDCSDCLEQIGSTSWGARRWRKEEILSLHWNQIDLEAEEIWLEVDGDKNDAGRVIAMDGEFLETVKAQRNKRKVVQITLLCFVLTCFTETEN